MNSKLIYLDTNMWNRLLDQNVDPQRLLRELTSNNGTLVLSGQTVYELAKTFLSCGPNAAIRAQNLFAYLKQYVDSDIPCAHDNMQQLHGEIRALQTGASVVVAFYSPAEYAQLRAEVEKFSRGILDDRAQQFIKSRKQFSDTTRFDQISHLQGKPPVKERLTVVPEDQLSPWLDKEMLAESGTAILAGHLLRMYRDLSPETALQTAHALLYIPPSRIAKGIVRADLYFNWRCAHRGSNPKDLPDDMYHVLNASYCDVYATAEGGQAKYASLLLNGWTKVALYDDQSPVNSWLLALA